MAVLALWMTLGFRIGLQDQLSAFKAAFALILAIVLIDRCPTGFLGNTVLEVARPLIVRDAGNAAVHGICNILAQALDHVVADLDCTVGR